MIIFTHPIHIVGIAQVFETGALKSFPKESQQHPNVSRMENLV